MPATDPLLDPARLAAVRELALTDAPQQEAFSSLGRLARQLLGVPVSVLSILTGDRHVVAGQSGFSDDPSGHVELPLSHSFCQHVARSGEALIVSDAREHDLVSGNLGVRDHSVIAYAGLPLKLSSGQVVGAFCAVDHTPRRWTGEQLQTLADLTRIAVTLLDQRASGLAAGSRDLVTGLPRKVLFTELVRDLLGRAEGRDRVCAVAVNLARFRLVNDDLGHEAGDEVLAQVGGRLEHLVNTRRPHGHASRIAADTFVMVATVPDSEPRGQFEQQVQRAIASQPFTADGRSQTIGARVATVTAEAGSTSADDLVQAAVQAIEGTRLRDFAGPDDLGGARGPVQERPRGHRSGSRSSVA